MPERTPAPFRIVVWLVLMLAGWGMLQYVVHASAVLRLLDRQVAGRGALWTMLAWDALYLFVAGATVAASAGVLMWRAWARRLLRGLSFVLAAYSLASAVLMFAQWHSYSLASADLIAHAADPDLARSLFAQARRITMTGLALKLLSVPLMAWLGWRLGTLSLVQRFATASRKG